MALSRRDVFLSGIVCFVAWGLVVHCFPLVWYIWYAFAGGAVCSLAFLTLLILRVVARSSDDYDDPSRVTVTVTTTIASVAPDAWAEEKAALKERARYQYASLYEQSPSISDELDKLLELMKRDFILPWYSHISRNLSFIDEVDKLLRGALATLRHRLLDVDVVQAAVSRIVPIVTAHLREFDHAERLVRGKNLERSLTESEELDLAIAGKYRHGRLHPAVPLAVGDSERVQKAYLRQQMGQIVREILPRSQVRSHVFFTLVREIVACMVMFPVVQLLSDPDTWNQLIEGYGRALLQDRKSVRKLRAALDQHASPAPKSARAAAFPRLHPGDSERRFERFVHAIRACNGLPDARRFRSEVASQLKRDMLVQVQDPVYIRRLNAGKEILEQRIAMLSNGEPSQRSRSRIRNVRALPRSRLEHATLLDVLRDPAGLSYFMEFMDRRRQMTAVQFWLVVEGLCNPLEDAPADDDRSETGVLAWTDTDRDDLEQLNQAYLYKPELHLPKDIRDAVQLFLSQGPNATPAQHYKARRAILKAQICVLERMQERHFPVFRRSDLFFKYLTSDDASDERASSAHSPTRRSEGSQYRRPSAIVRTSSAFVTRINRLRKTTASNTDLRSSTSSIEASSPLRRSLEGISASNEVEERNSADPLSDSIQSLDAMGDSDMVPAGPDVKVVQALEVALNNIVEDKQSIDESRIDWPELPTPTPKVSRESDALQSLLDLHDRGAGEQKQSEKPSIASLGLVNTSSRIGVFMDDDLFSDEAKFAEDEREDPEENDDEKGQELNIQEAVPGDLGLDEAIVALDSDLEKLATQEGVVDSLTMKAELTNTAAELRILRKSKASLQREMRRKELQRQQYMLQQRDNKLYGRATIRIKSVMVGTEEDGHEYGVYLVEVSRHAGEQMSAAIWAVARRYSQFHELNRRLRAQYPSVRHLDFPRRRMMLKVQQDFLDKRRIALEKYLQELLQLPDVCRSRELRAFLSQRAITGPDMSSSTSSLSQEPRDLMSRFYDSFTSGMDDVIGHIPVLDQLSVAGQSLLAAATQQLQVAPSTGASSSAAQDPLTTAEAEAELRAYESNRELEPFVKPICDVFLEVFELNKENNWLRGRAVVVILHQLLGGTIERKVRDNARALADESMLMRYIDLLREAVWPDGKLRRSPRPVRTPSERARTRTDAKLVLAALLPEVAGSVVGKSNAQAASRKIFATLNNPILTRHLIFTILDEIVSIFRLGGQGGVMSSSSTST